MADLGFLHLGSGKPQRCSSTWGSRLLEGSSLNRRAATTTTTTTTATAATTTTTTTTAIYFCYCYCMCEYEQGFSGLGLRVWGSSLKLQVQALGMMVLGPGQEGHSSDKFLPN